MHLHPLHHCCIAAIPSPQSNGLRIGSLTVHGYGLMYVLAIVAAVHVTTRRWQRVGGDRRLVREVALWSVPVGLLGGRLYHVVTSWDEVPHRWWGPFALWKGGMGMYGGIVLGTLTGLLVLHHHRADVPRFMDAVAPALLVAQAIGRVGNYVNQELFGAPTSLPWALHIDLAHRPPGYERFATFHPTFLYEIVWNLLLAALLVLLGARGRVRAPGLFALYIAGYALGRVGEELLRIDPTSYVLGMRLNFWVSVSVLLAGLAWFAHTQGWLRRGAAGADRPARPAQREVAG